MGSLMRRPLGSRGTSHGTLHMGDACYGRGAQCFSFRGPSLEELYTSIPAVVSGLNADFRQALKVLRDEQL